MEDRQTAIGMGEGGGAVLPEKSKHLLRDLQGLSGRDLLKAILESDDPAQLVRELPVADVFWLVKRIGPDDALPILQAASLEQWQYLLDLELWRRDRLDLGRVSSWLRRLLEADADQLADWLLADGEALLLHYLQRYLQVIVHETEEAYNLPEGFFTLDNVFFVRVTKPKYRKLIEGLLRAVAAADLERYQDLLLNLSSVMPAESEEDLYRFRSVRLAEHGFLPFEEASSIYAPLDPGALREAGHQALIDLPSEGQEMEALAPITPLLHAGERSLLAQAISRMEDPLLMDRLRLEFANLCNQIVSADGLLSQEVETLMTSWEKATGYLGLALEETCAGDPGQMVRVLRTHPLAHVFRVGYGLVLGLRWEAERWLRGSWFRAQGFEMSFWGEAWGGTLYGLTRRRPLRYVGLEAGVEYRDFTRLSELHEARAVLDRVKALDLLLGRLAASHGLEPELSGSPEATFHSLLFLPWARRLLGLDTGFHGLAISEARRLFERLRAGKKGPPYRMSRWEERFVGDLMEAVQDMDARIKKLLRNALALIWREFEEEYRSVPTDGLDGRFARFILIRESP